MATEYERQPADRVVERNTVTSVGGGAGVVALIVALLVGAFVFFTFYDRAPTPTVSTSPRVIVPDRSPPAKTAPSPSTAPAPSTK